MVMTRLNKETIKAALKHCEKKKVFTLQELTSLLECSVPNVRLKLRQWRTYTSYNKNGGYYTLPHVPAFDNYGLWRYRNIHFSRHGNLKQTIVHLITTSSAGLNGRQLGDILGLEPRSFLHHFRNCPGIQREKHCGVYVYFSDDPAVYESQVQKRRESACRSLVETISDIEAIMILVAVIRHYGISAEEILSLPEVRDSNITLPALQGFLEYHGLLKKMADAGR